MNRERRESDELKRHIHYLEANAEYSVSRAALVPELLDALKGLLEVHDAMGAGQSYAATKARAVIAKFEAD